MRPLLQSIALAATMLAAGAAHADCGTDSSDEAVKSCLAQDLRDSDKRINATYKLLMSSLDEAGKLSLRDEQRAWLKTRDKACLLNTKESDREKWLAGILADQPMTVCVVRYTFARVAELDQQLKQKAPAKVAEAPAAPAAPQLAAKPANAGEQALPAYLNFFDDGYKTRTGTSHQGGLWYLEVTIDRGHLAELGDAVLTTGFFNAKSGVMNMVSVRHTQVGMGPLVVGLALDLNDGFAYFHRDGQWKVTPGQTGSLAVPANLAYWAGIDGSSEVRELIKRGLVKVNLGQQPFQFPKPAGYRAWSDL